MYIYIYIHIIPLLISLTEFRHLGGAQTEHFRWQLLFLSRYNKLLKYAVVDVNL